MYKCALNLKVEPRQIQELDALARRHGLNRSELMRLILDNVQIVQRPAIGAVLPLAPTILNLADLEGARAQ